MKMQCPHCGVSGSIEDLYVGRKIRCPRCNNIFQVESKPEPAEDAGIDTPDSNQAVEISAQVLPAREAEKIVEETDATDPRVEVELGEADTAETNNEQSAQSAMEERAQTELPADDMPRADSADEAEHQVTPSESAGNGISRHTPSESENEAAAKITGTDEAATVRICSGCGKSPAEDERLLEQDGAFYCRECRFRKYDEFNASSQAAKEPASPAGAGDTEMKHQSAEQRDSDTGKSFSVGGILTEAWNLTAGVKGPIWVGFLVMYGVMFVLAFVLAALTTAGFWQESRVEMVGEMAVSAVSTLFTAGLMYMGVKRAVGKRLVWKDVFSGFEVFGKILIAGILQLLLILVGYLLLILPGVYLMVGYTMTMLLIIDKRMSPWQAMETSRKAIHKVWWQVCGLYFVMALICGVSAVPFGIGLVWTLPMSVVLAGVLYSHLFPSQKKAD